MEKDRIRIQKLLEALQEQKLIGEKEIQDIARMGGMTNRTYCVRTRAERLVVRLPGEGTEKTIDRKMERIHSGLAEKLKLDVPVIYLDQETGEKVTKFIENAVTMSPGQFRMRENIRKAAAVLKMLHTSGETTEVLFDAFRLAEDYEKIAADSSIELWSDYPETKEKVLNLRREHPVQYRAVCHNDTVCENWLCSSERMYLIDWEYAGLNDPFWDLATLSLEAGYGEEEDSLFLEEYQGDIFKNNAHRMLLVNKIFIDYLWSLWGKARVPVDGKCVEEYAGQRYDRLKNNLEKIVKC